MALDRFQLCITEGGKRYEFDRNLERISRLVINFSRMIMDLVSQGREATIQQRPT